MAASTGALAQQRVISPAPESVSVTVYRDPNRRLGREIQREWLGGYALITETRTIDLPAGLSEIRFEGVADSLLPASVIVSGLPKQPAEKNYDARLLSAGALVDAFLGKQVHIRRTIKKTGVVTDSEAIIRSGPNGIVLQTAAGFEALKCTGLSETLLYPNIPEGLSDKPTLSLRASSSEPIRATVRLSYLATQFDWQANYIAIINSNGRTLDLFAWLTLANSNDVGFLNAQTHAVAGEPNREEDSRAGQAKAVSPGIQLQCWPTGTTSSAPTSPFPPPPPPPAPERDGGDDEGYASIVVTGSRIPMAAMVAAQEELGDLKLYRVPEPVTVAANSQKQVALLTKSNVPFERVYALPLDPREPTSEPLPVSIMIRMKNSKVRGLGMPLPSGRVAVFETAAGRSMLAGEPELMDKAVGELVELVLGESPDVTYELKETWEGEPNDDGDTPHRYQLRLTNARPKPAPIEVALAVPPNFRLSGPSRRLGKKNGYPLWLVTVPANKSVLLSYRLDPAPAEEED